MSLRTKLVGLGAAGALAVAGVTAVVPGTASALSIRTTPTVSISGVEGANSAGACAGTFCNMFNDVVSVSAPGHAVTFTAAQAGQFIPLRVIAQDTVTCWGAHAVNEYTYTHDTAFGTTTLTFQPDLTCPAGSYAAGSEQSAQAQTENGLTTPYAGFDWYSQLQ